VPVYRISFKRYFRRTSDGETSFLELLLSIVLNLAQNGNQGSILTYSLFGQFLVTGLIGAFLITFFRIPGIRAWNQKSPVLRGGKPALLFPIGWQIAVQMGWSRGKVGKRPVLGSWNSPQNRYKNLLFYLHRVSVGDYLPLKGSRPPK
jgi:hypothetical protein